MRARLGFAIATDVRPQVLLLDEIMSVGDEEFRRRCKTRIESFRRGGATVVLVSHGLEMVAALCDRALFLDRGVMKTVGPTDQVVSEYTSTVLEQ